MKIIKSSNGYDVQVDDEYFEFLNQFTWYVNGYGYAQSGMNKGSGSCIHLHVWVAKQAGLDTSNEVDHKDRDKLNNQLSNLRPATRSQNCANTKLNTQGQYSQYRGVTWDKRRNRWFTQIKVNNKQRGLGSFRNEIEAAKRYDQVAFETWGEFATLNFPEDYNQATN